MKKQKTRKQKKKKEINKKILRINAWRGIERAKGERKTKRLKWTNTIIIRIINKHNKTRMRRRKRGRKRRRRRRRRRRLGKIRRKNMSSKGFREKKGQMPLKSQGKSPFLVSGQPNNQKQTEDSQG